MARLATLAAADYAAERRQAARRLAALERLALLDPGDRDPRRMAFAAARFLCAASHVAAMGDALWPEREEPGA